MTLHKNTVQEACLGYYGKFRLPPSVKKNARPTVVSYEFALSPLANYWIPFISEDVFTLIRFRFPLLLLPVPSRSKDFVSLNTHLKCLSRRVC